MNKHQAKEYLQQTHGLNEEDIFEFSDDLVEFRGEIYVSCDDSDPVPYFYQIDLLSPECPLYSEGFLVNGEKDVESSFILDYE